MRRLLPDGLAAWALLILIGGLVIAEVATLGAIYEKRAMDTRMAGFFHLAERVSSASRALAGEPADQRQVLADALSAPTFGIDVGSRPRAHSASDSDGEIAELESIMQVGLAESGITEVDVQRGGGPLGDAGAGADPGAGAGPVARFISETQDRYAAENSYVVSVLLGDASWVNFTIPVPPLPRLWSTDTVALTAFVIGLVLIASLWALRRLTAPYAVIAGAAERLGRDINAPALAEGGPRELRAAAHAFNQMQERLKRLLSDRDQLVAAISHDLRTPATRLRLRAEYVADDTQRTRMLADLDDIEAMTRSVLAFAHDSAQPEPRAHIDAISLLESLCGDLPDVTLELSPDLPARLPLSARPVALRRCLANLIDNAVRYGKRARVSLGVDATSVRVVVDDDGPGIPEAENESVFRPFHRLETSRNRETGGTGLGLTIARSVARAHGGDVLLANRPGGGLRAEVVLPRGPAGEPAGFDAAAARPRRARLAGLIEGRV